MDSAPDLVENVYYKLAVIDRNQACPPELMHTLAKAAMRDAEIHRDISLIYQQYQQTSTSSRYENQTTSLPPLASQVQLVQATESAPPRSDPYNIPSGIAIPTQPVTAPGSSLEPVQGPSPYGFQTGPKRQRRSSTPENMIRVQDNSGESRMVDIRSIKSPRAIPQCPRPPKSAAELARNLEAAATEEEEEPKEKAADYSKLLSRVERDLGWYGKYDNYSDAREQTAGMNVATMIESLLEKLAGLMDKHHSFHNRAHVLTVMREILMAVLQTEGSRVGSEVRNCAYQYDDNMVWAVEKLTLAQRRKLGDLGGGQWFRAMQALVDGARQYGVFERLPEVLSLIDPDVYPVAAAAATAAVPGGYIEIS